jgi:hypothetical protein
MGPPSTMLGRHGDRLLFYYYYYFLSSSFSEILYNNLEKFKLKKFEFNIKKSKKSPKFSLKNNKNCLNKISGELVNGEK